jgi:anti-sigma B factor antagonist
VANQTRSGCRRPSRGSAGEHPRAAGAGAPVAVVAVIGEVDCLTGTEWEALIGEELANRPRCLIVDLTRVGFVGSTALSILCRARDACARQGTALAFVGTGREDVLRQLRIAGLERLFVVDG